MWVVSISVFPAPNLVASEANQGCSTSPTVSMPTAPSPSETKVIPTWVTE